MRVLESQAVQLALNPRTPWKGPEGWIHDALVKSGVTLLRLPPQHFQGCHALWYAASKEHCYREFDICVTDEAKQEALRDACPGTTTRLEWTSTDTPKRGVSWQAVPDEWSTRHQTMTLHTQMTTLDVQRLEHNHSVAEPDPTSQAHSHLPTKACSAEPRRARRTTDQNRSSSALAGAGSQAQQLAAGHRARPDGHRGPKHGVEVRCSYGMPFCADTMAGGSSARPMEGGRLDSIFVAQ